ncbi:hypothetical protein ABTB72_19440, partial [Acinetobacter baumannii]
IDQALVQDPSNWRALNEKLRLAKKDGKAAETHQLLEVIHHYYPGCTPTELEETPKAVSP